MYDLLNKHFKISHHKHTGKFRPHADTSYLPLFILLLIVGIALMLGTVSAAHPGPQAGSIGLTGIMPGPAPTTAAVITSPSQNQHFTTSPIIISGTCPKTTLVEIYKNDIFAGSTPCDTNGNFSLSIDLLVGTNTLIARVYNALNEPGPDSKSVTVFYDALPPQGSPITPLSLGGPQLLLTTDAVYRGAFPESPMSISIGIIGGIAPYAIHIDWGDGSSDLISRNNDITFRASHTYHKPGTYQIVIQGSDSQARKAYLSVVAIVNGQPSTAAGGTITKTKVNTILVLWPLYLCALIAVVCFWLGEQREKHLLQGKMLQQAPQT